MTTPTVRPASYLVPIVVDAGGVMHVEVGVEVGADLGGSLPSESLARATTEVLLVVAANLTASLDPQLADLIGSALDHIDSTDALP